jgi:hypothetical protein
MAAGLYSEYKKLFGFVILECDPLIPIENINLIIMNELQTVLNVLSTHFDNVYVDAFGYGGRRIWNISMKLTPFIAAIILKNDKIRKIQLTIKIHHGNCEKFYERKGTYA